jgi:hypothetical protein
VEVVDDAGVRRRLEQAACGLLLVAALLVRVPHLFADFDRGTEGFQGAFFAIAAVNYERLGTSVGHGYPALIVDLEKDALHDSIGPMDALVYANHPPLVPLLAWGSARLLGPEGWSEAWRSGRAPEGLEVALRLPFFLLHILSLLIFWRILRPALGPSAALIALALLAASPVGLLFANLVNYENAALPFVLLAYGAYRRMLVRGGARPAWALGLSFLAAGAVTWAPVFFLPPLVLHSLWAPTAIGTVSIGARVHELWAPFLDGSRPLSEWLRIQLEHGRAMLGTPVLILAALGLLAGACRRISPAWNARMARGEIDAPGTSQGKMERVDLATPLVLGACLQQLAFYRHTLDAQWNFFLWAAPGAAAAAAMLLASLARPSLRLRAGVAPLVLIVLSAILPGVVGANARLHELRAPASSGDGAEAVALPRALGLELAPLIPRGSIALLPADLGANLACTYYAWRNLYWTDGPSAALPPWLEASCFLRDAPVDLLLPEAPPIGARVSIGTLRTALAEEGIASEELGHWRRYALRSR